MTCPICGAATKVYDSRVQDEGAQTWRRRKCTECGHRFTSYEYEEERVKTPELEKDLEKKLRKKVESYGGRFVKFVSPSSAGVPDRIAMLPGGRVVFVEMKRPKGGEISPLQKMWAKWLIALDCNYEQVWNNEDLRRFEEKYLRERRTR